MDSNVTFEGEFHIYECRDDGCEQLFAMIREMDTCTCPACDGHAARIGADELEICIGIDEWMASMEGEP